MNKRIEELAKQAGVIALSENGIAPPLEKFVKLIVAECAGIYCKIDNGNLHIGTDDYLEALHKTFRS